MSSVLEAFSGLRLHGHMPGTVHISRGLEETGYENATQSSLKARTGLKKLRLKMHVAAHLKMHV